MSAFKKLLGCVCYYVDAVRSTQLSVNIERFELDQKIKSIVVFYRLGRQKLLNKSDIFYFENEYFENISIYDQHRLTKMATLQKIFNQLFKDKQMSQEVFIQYLQRELKNESLF